MQYTFELRTRLLLRQVGNKSRHEGTMIQLAPLPPLDSEAYVLPDGSMTSAGHKAALQVAIQAIVGLLHMGDSQGHEPSHKAIEWVLKEIQEGFARPADVDIIDY